MILTGEGLATISYMSTVDYKSILILNEAKLDECRGQQLHQLVHIDLKAQFVILFNDIDNDVWVIDQCDNNLQVLNNMKEHFKSLDLNDKRHSKYMIIDMQSIIPYFWKYGKLRETTRPVFDIYRREDLV